MKSVSVMLTILVTACFTKFTNAQPYIEIDFKGQAEILSSNELVPFGARMVFDTSAPPIEPDMFSAQYAEVVRWYEYESTSYEESIFPLISTEREIEYVPVNATLHYAPIAEYYEVRIITEDAQYFVGVFGTKDAFAANMTSLPDNVEDYEFESFSSPMPGFRSVDFTSFGPDSAAVAFVRNRVDGTGGPIERVGYIHVTISEVDKPNTTECLIDLNNDGNLDFFDVSAFLQLFAMGCP